MRLASDALTRQRRKVAAFNLGAIAALLPVAAYQTGLLRHLPEPPLLYLDADRVDASGEAYVTLRTAAAPLGIASYAATVALAAMGADDRAQRHPWLVLAFTGKVATDALGGAVLTLEQLTKHRRFCGYCLLASALAIAAVPAVVPEVRAALRSL